MHTIIFANGTPGSLPKTLPDHDLLVAADGGARHAWQSGAGFIPDVIIGDLDSLAADELAGFDRAGASIYRFPAKKDETDLELALNFALEAGATEITLYGLLGGRWDMTFANLLLLADPRYASVRFRIWEGETQMHILRGGESLRLSGRVGDLVSAIPLGGAARGVTYQGLTWPLENATLPFGTPRGVSNSLAARDAEITLNTGVLLITHTKT